MTDEPPPGPRRRNRPQPAAPSAAAHAGASTPPADAPNSPAKTGDAAERPDAGPDQDRARANAPGSRGPSRAQLIRLALMLSSGCTQQEMSDRLGACPRTIRYWIKKLNLADLGLQDACSPQAELNQALLTFRADIQKLQRWETQAESNGDLKLVRQFAADRRKVESERRAFLASLGVFNDAGRLLPHSQDGAAARAENLSSLLAGLDFEDEADDPPEADNDNAQ